MPWICDSPCAREGGGARWVFELVIAECSIIIVSHPFRSIVSDMDLLVWLVIGSDCIQNYQNVLISG